MPDITELGWDARTLGDLDLRKVKAPYVRLVSFTEGNHGDVVYLYELRVTQPNAAFLSTLAIHSMKHLLLEGFRRSLPQSFVCVAPMASQTGFCLVLLNEGRMQCVVDAYERVLNDILEARSVPFATAQECGRCDHHDIDLAKSVARRLLERRSAWLRTL